ncbi:type I-B CRISPR-associated protein Cas7/Cst2/DevR [Salinispora tropica]|uniref:CRISPR-associated regulatory protein, DevR family n=1 Tax=Salinispora tropica (strain ATCC BAA-916 / DSM 44818 / JCM 13857 / NBRC 105044 / CNB-440) TaxID=369723 RepID=A4X3M8_SALTO|nr:type I-B CRISPR-associated protein Cas7/Cst2/DevR [Salinispora tropica]ABP53478.1 CRISPR-associated regulatory protein, DevR family [Salinispora tropica CNB-440]
MAFLAGKIVLAVTAGAPNNGRGEATTARVKKTLIRRQPYPYVSAQAFRRWLRDTMAELGSLPSPTERVGRKQGTAQKATTAADPIRYADDDLFGYLKATAKSEETNTTLRDSPFMVGTLLAVEPARPTEDYGVMARGIDDPVLHAHEFYTADLAAPLLLDVPRIGTFTLPAAKGAGRANYLSQEAAMQVADAVAVGAEPVMFRGQPAVRLPLAVRRERAALLLEALAEVTGGAKKGLHYGDRTPTLLMLLAMDSGVNPLDFAISGADDGSGLRVSGDVLRAELEAWNERWQPPVRVGWRPGFKEIIRKQFESDLAAEIDTGEVLIDHPRTMLRALAAELRAGTHDSWFDDPAR